MDDKRVEWIHVCSFLQPLRSWMAVPSGPQAEAYKTEKKRTTKPKLTLHSKSHPHGQVTDTRISGAKLAVCNHSLRFSLREGRPGIWAS